MKYVIKKEAVKAHEPGSRYVEVALSVPQLKPLTYRVEAEFVGCLAPGLRVLVPLGRRKVTGYVIHPPGESPPPGVEPSSIKSVLEIIDDEPLLTPELLELTRWVAEYYCCGWGEALKFALPSHREKKTVERYRLSEAGRLEAAFEEGGLGLPGLKPSEGKGSHKARILVALRKAPRTLHSLAASFGRGTRPELMRLVDAGFVEKIVDEVGGSKQRKVKYARLRRMPEEDEFQDLEKRAKRQAEILRLLDQADDGRMRLGELESLSKGARAACEALEKKGWVRVEEDLLPDAEHVGESSPRPGAPSMDLTDEQRESFELVKTDIVQKNFSVTLLHGVTGSGKTEVYIQLAQKALENGLGALILVPEIGLTPQLLARFQERFGQSVACLHSAYTDKKRISEWRRIKNGDAPIVVGTRSAVFAPVSNLGMIAVDEEHDSSYKQEESPRYHARDTGIVRARNLGVPVVLGSATPSIESYTSARSGRYRLRSLSHRPTGGALPQVRLVDLRKEAGSDPKTPELLTRDLAAAIGERLERGEQTLLFLNRRGFSSVILCRGCGEALQCPHCSIPLTFHREGGGRVQCHWCDYSAHPPNRCSSCHSDRVGYFGVGTERVEQAVKARFPEARVQRLDRDTARRAGAYESIFGAMRSGEIDILIGTQMVAKGHDFPKLTLVGVVVADVGLHLPDFRASERTFQLLTQVAGRAGRADLPGEVIIQTFRPDHFAVQCARTHDYAGFYKREASARERMGYPPYRRLARLRFESKDKHLAAKAGEWVASYLRKHGVAAAGRAAGPGGVEYLGPAPAPLVRIRGLWRYHMILKAKGSKRLGEAVTSLTAEFDGQAAFSSVRLAVDVDPMSLM
ncbi:MAG: primosomal protein N' [Nitrospinae bacterium]|nr:primosomal protein N' [Nitrospinota bacterium]